MTNKEKMGRKINPSDKSELRAEGMIERVIEVEIVSVCHVCRIDSDRERQTQRHQNTDTETQSSKALTRSISNG